MFRLQSREHLLDVCLKRTRYVDSEFHAVNSTALWVRQVSSVEHYLAVFL